MGLIDRLRKPRNFADGTSLQKLPAGGQSEIGVAGESLISYEQTEAPTDDVTIDAYTRMLNSDGTVRGIVNILTLPIKSASWELAPDENDTDGKQAALVERVLRNPPHKNGMATPFPLVLGDMLRATVEGFRLYEKVWRVDDEGYIIYDRLASRDARTIKLQRGDDGGYAGAVQRASFKGTFHDVQIPAWKTFLFTYNKDRNYLYGESALKSCYVHYQNKRKLTFLAQLGAQTRAVPPTIITGPPSGDNSFRDKALAAFKNFGNVNTVAYIPNNMTANAHQSQSDTETLPLIDHENTEMARSVLAQFIMLGTTSRSAGGSHALSSDQSELFITSIKGVMQNIEDHINFYLIPDLIDLNFAEPAYPEFHFQDLTEDTKTLLKDAFTQLVTKGNVSDAMKKGIEDQIATVLDIDLESAAKEIADDAAEGETSENPPAPQPAADTTTPGEPAPTKNLSDKAAGGDPKAVAAGGDHSPQPRSAFSSLR